MAVAIGMNIAIGLAVAIKWPKPECVGRYPKEYVPLPV
jgi:hypothetical protein